MQRLAFFLIGQKIQGLLDEMLLILVDNPVFYRVKCVILINSYF